MDEAKSAYMTHNRVLLVYPRKEKNYIYVDYGRKWKKYNPSYSQRLKSPEEKAYWIYAVVSETQDIVAEEP